MRQLFFIVALVGAFSLAHAAKAETLKTNSVNLGTPGTLEILTPPDWILVQTNLYVPDNPPTFEVHSPNNAVVIRLYVRWDGFGGTTVKPTEAQMSKIVSNNVLVQYLPVAVEKKFELEKFHGPAANGIFARITDAHWTLLVKDTYPNIAEGMVRCENIWANFSMLTHDKNGPEFKAGLKVLESMRRQ